MTVAAAVCPGLSVHAADDELSRIAEWWLQHAVDRTRGGFFGEISANSHPKPDADKGSVLTCRILWFFSALYARSAEEVHRRAAERAWLYLRDRFHDPEFGGIYWKVAADGRVDSDRKQSYALAFAIYACVAWHAASADPEPLEFAIACFQCLERHARDRRHGGYLEAHSQRWETLFELTPYSPASVIARSMARNAPSLNCPGPST